MRVLVTGATGYLGQQLVVALAANGYTVRGFARRPCSPHLPVYDWHQGDVCDAAALANAAEGCNAIVHLACLPLAPSFQNPQADFAVNARGTLNALEAARSAHARLVYTSTAQVYGKASRLPITEDAPATPHSPYAASKLCGEVLCTTFARCYGLDTTVLRLFNIYGPALDGSPRPTVEAIFARQVLAGQAPRITGAREEGRDFLHVSDAVQAILLALEHPSNGAIYNIGSGILTTLYELATLLIELTGGSLEPVVESDGRPPLQLQADTTRACDFLGFRPTITLRTGLGQLLEQIDRVDQ